MIEELKEPEQQGRQGIELLSKEQQHYMRIIVGEIYTLDPKKIIFCGSMRNPTAAIRSPDYLRMEDNNNLDDELKDLAPEFIEHTDVLKSLEKSIIPQTIAEETLVTSNHVFGHPHKTRYDIHLIPGHHIHIAYCNSIKDTWLGEFYPNSSKYGSEANTSLAKFKFLEPEEAYNLMLNDLFKVTADVALRKGDELLIKFFVDNYSK